MDPSDFEPTPVEESLARLLRSGSSIGDCAVFNTNGEIVCVVSGYNGDTLSRTEGPSTRWAWWYAIGQARELGILGR
jgi:hypothetical protein